MGRRNINGTQWLGLHPLRELSSLLLSLGPWIGLALSLNIRPWGLGANKDSSYVPLDDSFGHLSPGVSRAYIHSVGLEDIVIRARVEGK